MIDPQQATKFVDLLRYLYCLGRPQFEAFARSAWSEQWEHMCRKWYDQCKQNPWEFCCSLDPQAFRAMVVQYNQR